MTYALVEQDKIVQVGALPRLWWADTRWHRFNAPTKESNPSDYGWFEVVETPRPPDTDTTTVVHSIQLVNGIPTVVWVPIAREPGEVSEKAAKTLREELTSPSKLQDRLDRIKGYKTNSDIVAALARSNSTVIPTTDLNRLIKTVLRRQARQDAAIALLVRLLKTELLSDIQDTIDVD